MTTKEKTLQKPFSPSSNRNQQPIWAVLQNYIKDSASFLEVGSGTGQHANYFCSKNPKLLWQPTNLSQYVEGCNIWQQESGLQNVGKCIHLDVKSEKWPVGEKYTAAYTANTFHIMSIEEVSQFWRKAPQYLMDGAYIFIYGPFKYQGQFTSKSNQIFDQQLKESLQSQGLRDIEVILDFAKEQNFTLMSDHTMPANNQLLVFRHSPAS